MFHELFDGQTHLPYHIFLIDAETEHIHAHTELEICFLLCGNAEFHINQKNFPLYEHDLIIIHPLSLHQIQRCSAGCRVLFLQIDLFAFQKYISGLSDISFEFSNVMNNRSHTLYQTLYQSLRNILNTALSGNSIWRLIALQEIINILSCLISYYQNVPATTDHVSISHEEHDQLRMLSILEYLNKNWQKSLTLASVSEVMEMSTSYFSRFFKKMMGIGFLSYLTSLRLKRSLALLLDTDMPIIEIALECGFNDYKTYGRLFKKEFGETPQIYRKTHASQKYNSEPEVVLQPTQVLEQLVLTSSEAPSSKRLSVALKLDLNMKTDTKKRRIPVTHTITVGSATQLLRHKMQEHILYAQKQINLRSVRFFGAFSGNMRVYQEDSKGRPSFNWEYLDEAFDFLAQNQLSPFLVLDDMPDALSTLKLNIHELQREELPAGQTCIPQSQENFLALIREFACHYNHRYQHTGFINHCRIQLWMFPESPENIWNGTETQFFELVEQTYFTFRKYAPKICLGAPAVMNWHDFSMLKRFLIFCQHKGIEFDFFCINAYGFTRSLNNDYPAIYAFYERNFPYLDADKLLEQSTKEMTTLLSQEGFSKPVVVTEWSLNPYRKDLSKDTIFMATWMTECMAKLSSDIAEVCYCQLTDPSDSSGYEFIGGQGLLTHSGIPKPSFCLFRMLGYLGTKILSSGDDYLLTKTQCSWQLLIYNYSYYNDGYLNGKQELLFEEDRYNIYKNSLNKIFQIQIKLTPGKYRLETIWIDREHCAPYDEWIKMGKPEYISAFYHNYLMNKCYPGLHVETINTSNHLQIQKTVPIHGISVINIEQF